jgi:hypothetical protein
MRLEMYVRDMELGKVAENRFDIFHIFLVFFQCTHTHVVLSKEREERELLNTSGTKDLATITDLYSIPPGKRDAPPPVLEGHTPANRDEALCREGIYEVDCTSYHVLRHCHWLCFVLVSRLVKVDFGHRRLNRAQRIPRGAYVDFVYGLGR